MSFPSVPNHSKNTIDRAGKILGKENPRPIELAYATKIVEQWRACHAYPLNTFRATLRMKIKNFPNGPLMAQRLKRFPTIASKLKRYPNMELTRMQDIGGIRAILDSIKSVRKLQKEYESKNFGHDLLPIKDYIRKPKTSGYRGVHMVFKYKNQKAYSYNGLLIELQIRTKLQHIWATTVETMGTFTGQALKSSEGNKKWLDFFTVTSAIFAKIEKTHPVPGYEKKSIEELRKDFSRREKDLGALYKMKSLASVAELIHGKLKGHYYHLIILNSIQKQVQVRSYPEKALTQATSDYASAEKRIAKGEKIEAVLVAAGPLKTLKRAYPNYFLDTKEFVQVIEKEIMSKI